MTTTTSPDPTTDSARPPYAYGDLDRLMGLMTGDEKHAPSATSTLDVLWVLYDRILRIDPARPHDDDRDRFVLSKGHGPMAYYAVLAARGFIDERTLAGWAGFDSPLGWHPDRNLVPGVEVSSGSLGHGMPIAVGMALGLRARGKRGPRIFCLVGDAELDEGSNHEAIAVAARLALDALTVVVIDNHSASLGWPGGIERRFAVEGWSATTVDGRDHAAIEAALTAPHPGVPHAVVAVVEAKS
ncbi:MAG TPA: thiamine pyrophosphate-dependent enzyme [Dehalococcoidia bacterium]|nr:thiamine pyrophosphate-dependent enzyme [Dehalococcoidia bacterium]